MAGMGMATGVPAACMVLLHFNLMTKPGGLHCDISASGMATAIKGARGRGSEVALAKKAKEGHKESQL